MNNRFEKFEVNAFLNENYEREFLIENLLPAGEPTDDKYAILYGKTQVGKSQLAMQMALHVVYNIPFLWDKRFRINNAQKRPVLYLALEGGELLTKQILQKQVRYLVDKGYCGTEFKNIVISADNSLIKDYDVETASFVRLERKIQEIDPCLVIYDNITNLACMMGQCLSSQTGINAIIPPLQELAKKYCFTNLFVSHPTKSSKNDDVYEMAGGHNLVEFAHTILRLSNLNDKTKNILNLKIVKTNLLENKNPITRVVKNNNLICEVEE